MQMSNTGRPRRRVRIHAMYVVGLLAAMAFFNTADQTVGGAVLGNIQAEFHLSDDQLGLTASVFTMALASAPSPSAGGPTVEAAD